MGKDWVPYVVQQGDHVPKLAFRFGADEEELWSHEKNAAVAKLRKEKGLLYPGDVLHVPDEPPAALDVNQSSANKYKATVPKVPVKLSLASTTRSLAGQEFEVHGIGEGREPLKGKADGSGNIAFEVPVWVRELTVKLPKAGMIVPMRIGDLDPMEETSGLAHRLQNLGFLPAGNLTADEVTAGLRSFQKDKGIEATGVLDDGTKKALEDAHGS